MTNDLISSLFFNPKEELKTRVLNADIVEATINQLIAELKEQEMEDDAPLVVVRILGEFIHAFYLMRITKRQTELCLP